MVGEEVRRELLGVEVVGVGVGTAVETVVVAVVAVGTVAAR